MFPFFRGKGTGSLLLFFATLFSTRSASAYTDAYTAALIRDASAAYEAGDCPTALELYGGLVTSPTAPTDVWDEALFRRGYCFLTLGDNERSFRAFSGFVLRHPENAEARLKLAQSHFNLGEFDRAQDEALRVRPGSFEPEAKVLAGRSLIELRRYPEAVEALRRIPPGGAWPSVGLYWSGVAFYQAGQEEKAVIAFRWSIYKAPADAWTREAAEAWIQRIRGEQRFRLRVGLGLFYDGNVAQSATATPGQSNQPLTGAGDAAYQRDRGYSLDVGVDSAVVATDRFRLNSAFTASGTFYQTYSAFDYESFGVRLDSIFPFTPFLRANLALAYLDTRYDYRYYQDYLILNPGISWDVRSNVSLGLSLALTDYVVTRSYWSVSPTLTASWNQAPYYSWAGFNYTRSSGDSPVIVGSGTLLGLSSGTLFSGYHAFGAYVGGGRSLPYRFDLNTSVSYTQTGYDDPGLPAAASLTFSRDPRSDGLLSWSTTLSRVLAERKLTLGLTVVYTTNASSGFQGLLVDANTVPNYNYSRRFVSLNLGITP